ncbi:MAG: tetratricopeptide repeat protein [Oscillatoria sp. SIO1A7]|nr:tetratricopeptide repeat protein [Oscillatoria sp. SIO1A7]
MNINIGQLLDRRYRIVKVLGSGAFGQTYLAADTHRPGYPQCVVRQLRPTGEQPKNLHPIELIVKQKAESIEKLGKNNQIPQLLAFFEEEEEFYVVEEYIPGSGLDSELFPGQPLGEEKTVALLEEILEILIFVHSNEITHGNIKPENLIRHQVTGKLVLIDFKWLGADGEELLNGDRSIPEVGVGITQTYLPQEKTEEERGYAQDIHAVGAIGIQALVGLSIDDLSKLPLENNGTAGTIIWRHRVEVRAGLADVIDKMVSPDPLQRYKSAKEVMADLRRVKIRSQVPPPPPPVPQSSAQTTAGQTNGQTTGQTTGQLPAEWQQDGKKKAEPIANEASQPESGGKQQNWIGVPIARVGAAVALLLALILGWTFYSTYARKNHFQELLGSGQQRSGSGDNQGAIQEYNKAIELNPNNHEAYHKRGNAQFDLRNYKEAIEDYTAAIKLKPEYVNAYYNRGLANDEAGNYGAAVEDYSKVIEIEPTDRDAYYKRAVAYHNLGNYSAAIADYTEAIQRNIDDLATAYISRGLSHSADGNKQAAIADYTQAITLEPNNADAYYSRGRARFFLADYQGAMEDYTEAIQLTPENGAIYANRCGAYLNLGEYEKASADCTRAIELNPLDTAAYDNRCIAYMNIAEYAKAIADCTQAIQVNPKNTKAYVNRGLARAAAGDSPGAIEDYTEAIRLRPDDAVAFTNRGKVYADIGDYGEALVDYTQAIRLKPNYDLAHYHRGMIRVKLGDREGAIEDFRQGGKLCLDQGKTGCYNDAQYQIEQLQQYPSN